MNRFQTIGSFTFTCSNHFYPVRSFTNLISNRFYPIGSFTSTCSNRFYPPRSFTFTKVGIILAGKKKKKACRCLIYNSYITVALKTTGINIKFKEMGTITKIQSFFLGNLNNSEYANHMNRFYALIPKKEEEDRPVIESIDDPVGPASVGISDEQMTALRTDLDLLDDLVNQSRISDESAMLADEDKVRDDLVVYFTTVISQARKSPVLAQKTASVSLYNQVSPYIGIYKLADQQETQQITGLLIDMEKEPNKTNVATLGLTPVLEALKASNQRFIELTAQRTENRAAASIDNSKTVRARIDPLYDDMITMATATNIINPTATTAAFITAVNALVAETKTRYNQRIGIAKANKDKKEPDDRPEIE